MRNKTIIWFFCAMLLLNCAYAVDFELNFTTTNVYTSSSSSAFLNLVSLKYEPYPVNPGEYFTLWLKAENPGGELTENATFELVPEFPFSLDSNEDPVRKYGRLSSAEPVILEYKIRTDKDAVEGENKIKIRYNTDGKGSSWATEDFDITVTDVQTDFDLVLQEVTEGEASIAIANTGKNAAYSVIVRVPEQDSFEAVGTDGQMVGNLENGDYTLVGFQITGKKKASGEKLKIQIDYTDTIGERRSLIKEIPFNANNGASYNLTASSARNGNIRQTNQTTTYQQWWFWAIIIVVLYSGWRLVVWIKRRTEHLEEKKSKK